ETVFIVCSFSHNLTVVVAKPLLFFYSKMYDFFLSGKFFVIILKRLVPWYRQTVPFSLFQQFGRIDHLPYMIRVMTQLPVNGIHDGMSLITDIDDLPQLLRWRESSAANKQSQPSFHSFSTSSLLFRSFTNSASRLRQ